MKDPRLSLTSNGLTPNQGHLITLWFPQDTILNELEKAQSYWGLGYVNMKKILKIT